MTMPECVRERVSDNLMEARDTPYEVCLRAL